MSANIFSKMVKNIRKKPQGFYNGLWSLLLIFGIFALNMSISRTAATVYAQEEATPTALMRLGAPETPLPNPPNVEIQPPTPPPSQFVPPGDVAPLPIPTEGEVIQPVPAANPFSDSSSDDVWPWGHKNPEPKAAYNSVYAKHADQEEDKLTVSMQQNVATTVSAIGGSVFRVSIPEDSNYAYVGKAYRLTIMNITNPADPFIEGNTITWPDMVLGVDVDNNEEYAYVAAGNQGLRIVDITDKKNPNEVSYYNNSENGRAYDVKAFGSRVFVADGEAGLQIIDVSNPRAPKRIGCFDTSGSAYDVDVFTREVNATTKTYAAIADEYNGLRIVDVTNMNCPCPCPPTNPTCPTEVTYYDSDSNMGRAVGVVVDPRGNIAYVADDEDGLLLIDLSDLSIKPLPLLGRYDTPQNAYSVDVSYKENIAYIGDGNKDVIAVDVSDPRSPKYVGAYGCCDIEGNCFANDVKVHGSYLFVADPPLGLHVLNTANPTRMSLVYQYYSPSATMGIEYQGYAYVSANSAGLRIINFPNYNTPNPDGSLPNYSGAKEVGFFDTPGWAYAVQINWPYAYVADWDRGLRILNVSNPAAPYEIAYFETNGLARDVAIYNGFAYIADRMNGVRVIDVRDPQNPLEVKSPAFNTECRDARAVYEDGGYIFVADGICGLRVFEAAAPEHSAHIDTLGPANDVVARGKMIYVAASAGGGVQVIRFEGQGISATLQLTTVNSVDTDGDAFGVDLDGALLYLADGSQGVRVFDVIDPSQGMKELAHYPTRGSAGNVRVFLNAIFAAGGDGGLQVLQVPLSTVTSTITGRVTLNGVSMVGVTVTNGNGISVTTDASGNYTFTGLSANTYTITASMSGYSFSPANRSVKVPPNATNQDFAASSNCLAGQIMDTSSRPIANVTVSISGSKTYTVSTDANGYYSAVGIYTNCGGVPNGTYTITPSKKSGSNNYTFFKASETVTVPPGRTNINFVGSIPSKSPAGVISETQPTFIWEASADSATTRYRLLVDGPSGSIIDEWYDGAKICKDNICSVKPDVTLVEGKYVWQVQTYAPSGITGLELESTFMVSRVPMVTLISPLQTITDKSPTYKWYRVENATQYRIAVNLNGNNVIDAMVDADKVCTQDKCALKVSQSLNVGSTYEWKVQAISPMRDGQWSEALSFTVK